MSAGLDEQHWYASRPTVPAHTGSAKPRDRRVLDRALTDLRSVSTDRKRILRAMPRATGIQQESTRKTKKASEVAWRACRGYAVNTRTTSVIRSQMSKWSRSWVRLGANPAANHVRREQDAAPTNASHGRNLDPVPGYPVPATDAVRRVMQGNRRDGTRPEVLLRSHLHRKGYRFRRNHHLRLHGVLCFPDVLFTKQKLAVFVDGCFWHACPVHGTQPRRNVGYWQPKLQRNVERDRRNTLVLEKAGWTVLRIWEHVPLGEAVSLVEDALRRSGDADH